jgi:hypothetical protein
MEAEWLVYAGQIVNQAQTRMAHGAHAVETHKKTKTYNCKISLFDFRLFEQGNYFSFHIQKRKINLITF